MARRARENGSNGPAGRAEDAIRALKTTAFVCLGSTGVVALALAGSPVVTVGILNAAVATVGWRLLPAGGWWWTFMGEWLRIGGAAGAVSAALMTVLGTAWIPANAVEMGTIGWMASLTSWGVLRLATAAARTAGTRSDRKGADRAPEAEPENRTGGPADRAEP